MLRRRPVGAFSLNAEAAQDPVLTVLGRRDTLSAVFQEKSPPYPI
jgi:hypothetical protein